MTDFFFSLKVDAKPVLEPRSLRQHDRVHAHQEALHQEPRADQPVRHHARGTRARHLAVGRGSACCESGDEVSSKIGMDRLGDM